MTRQIPLPCGAFALVDEADFERVRDRNWRLNKSGTGYAIAGGGAKGVVYMHRLVAEPPPHLVVDHINGNTLDNRRANLRVCTQRENIRNKRRPSHNTSGYKGVQERDGYFRALLMLNQRQYSLGQYSNAVAAALAYDRAAIEHFGEFAKPNFDPSRDWIFPQELAPRPRSGQAQKHRPVSFSPSSKRGRR